MMPVYFNFASHLWIAYLFFCNGLLMHWLLRSYSSNYRELTQSIEACVLFAFFISIAINGVLLVLLDYLEQPFSLLKLGLPCLSLILLLAVGIRFARNWRIMLEVEWNFWRLGLYCLVFITLFYNGGLIEQIADSWWHMSYANKIALANSFDLQYGHLEAVTKRFYPLLWHGNLALATTLSGEVLPVLWNSFTAWGAVIKTMGYYLFAFALGRNRVVAFLSTLLLLLLPGMAYAYMRVSAWPSHIAYAAWFVLFFIGFYLLDKFGDQKSLGIACVGKFLFRQWAVVLCFLLIYSIVFFTHKLELLWFVFGMLFYAVFLLLYQSLSQTPSRFQERGQGLFLLITALALFAIFCYSGWLFYKSFTFYSGNPDLLLSFVIPMVVLAILVLLFLRFFLLREHSFSWLLKPLILLILFILLVSLDLRQIRSLFNPDLAYGMGASREYALKVLGHFGGELRVPGWHLQLRGGLLYSGILALPLSLILAYYRPNRLTLFTCACAWASLLFCVSGYFYQWIGDTLNYHSPWRIMTLLFHPVIYAFALYCVWCKLGEKR